MNCISINIATIKQQICIQKIQKKKLLAPMITHEKKCFCDNYVLSCTQCGNLRIFQPLRFYVKSILFVVNENLLISRKI